MDSQLRARHGNKLAAEVRAGRPGRARLRAYCNEPIARITYGHVAWSCNGDWDDCLRAWCEDHDGTLFLCAVCGQAEGELTAECPGWQQCDLAGWLTGLTKVAWAPEFPARRCPSLHGASEYACNCSGWVETQVDPAHWVLVAAAVGAARACLVARGSRPARQHPTRTAIDAAARWLREPSEANRKACVEAGNAIADGFMQPSEMPFAALALGTARPDGKTGGLVRSVTELAGILGDQATRGAAAAEILSLTGSVVG